MMQSRASAPPEARGSAAAAESSTPAGLRFGDYLLEQEIAHGGMGVVYRARQLSLGRTVAVKLLLLGRYSSAESIERFRREAQSAAALRHPNIVAIHEIGEHEGQQFFSMDYVEGQSLAGAVRAGPMEPRRSAEVVAAIAEAIQFAHEQGVLHRDLKPSNVLLDAFGQVRITDFGLAKKLGGSSDLTLTGQVVGTPSYLSPEQAAGKLAALGPTSDVYSIGALMYELLTGRPPFLSNSLQETLVRIQNDEPVSPRALNPALHRDLETICLKCLQKEPERRYGSAHELAMDINRHLNDQPVLARPPSTRYFLKKFIARNKWPVILSATVAVLTLAGLVGTSLGLRRATRERNLALSLADEARRAEFTARVAQTNALRQAYSASMLSASDSIERAQIDAARHYLDSAPAELRGWEWRHLASRLDLATRVQDQPRSDASLVYVLPDGVSYYEVGNTPAPGIRQYNMETGRLLAKIPTGNYCFYSYFNAAAKQMTLQVGDPPDSVESIETWDLEHGVLLYRHPLPRGRAPFWGSPDGSQIAYRSGREVYILDTKSGTSRGSPTTLISTANAEEPMAFSPDGRRVAVCISSGEVALLDANSLAIVSTFKAHDNLVRAMAFSPDSRLLATASQDIRITDVTTDPPSLVCTPSGHVGMVLVLRFSPDGSILASCGFDRTLRLWETRTGTQRGAFESDSASPYPSFLPSGQTLINCDREGVRFWDVDSSSAWVLRGHHSFVYPVLLSPDGATIFSGGWDGFVGQPGCMRFWDAATGELIAATGVAQDYVRAADWSKDGARLAVSISAFDASSSRIDILDTPTGATVASVKDLTRAGEWGTGSMAFDPAAQNVVWIDYVTGMAHLADAHTGAVRKSRRVFNCIGTPSRVAWSPDGSLIAVNNVNKAMEPTIDLLDAQSLESVRQWPHGSSATITSLSFSPDGRRILAASTTRTIRVWDAATGTLVHELVGHGNEVLCAKYSPDGRRIASGGRDNNVRIWDAATFDQLACLGGHKDYVYSLAWAPDSQELISGSGDHTVRIWDTVPMKDRMRARRERQALLGTLEPKVRQLFADFGEAAKVAEVVKADASLSPRERQVALQVVLRISLDRLNAAAETRH
jgi:WD40 repeat protein/serine/threonine protein kinase